MTYVVLEETFQFFSLPFFLLYNKDNNLHLSHNLIKLVLMLGVYHSDGCIITPALPTNVAGYRYCFLLLSRPWW